MTKEEALGLLLRKCREKAGMTQEQIARKLHWSQSCVSNAEKGKRLPDIFKIMDWARVTQAQEALALFVAGADVSYIIQTVLDMVACTLPLIA